MFVSDYFFAKEACDLGYVLPVWVETINNGADIYTKAVPAQILDRLRPLETGYSLLPLPPVDVELSPASKL